MTEYTNSINIAGKLITKKGRDIIIRRGNKTEPSDPWKQDSENESDYRVKGFFFNESFGRFASSRRGNQNRANDVVQTNNETVLVAALNLSIVPTTEDTLVDCLVDKAYTIIFVDSLKPGSEDIIYSIGIRT